MILVKGREDVFRKRPILGQTESMQRQNITGDNNTQISAGGNVRTNRPEEEIFRKRPILGNRIKEPVKTMHQEEIKRPILGNRILVPNRDKPVKVKEPVQNVPLPKVDPTPPQPEAPEESSPMDAAMEEIRRAAEEREKFAQMMGGAFSDGTNMITGLSPEARDMIGLLMAQGIPANQAQDIARQKLGE